LLLDVITNPILALIHSFFYRSTVAPSEFLKCSSAKVWPSGLNEPTHDAGTVIRYPLLYASTAVCRMQMSVTRPVRVRELMPLSASSCPSLVPANALYRVLSMKDMFGADSSSS